MTKAQLVFDPFSEEFFNSPYDIYRRMREEAPVYYDETYDFYALTRHEDVAAGFKDFETYSSAHGIDLAQVQSEEPPPHSIIFMDPPEHRAMRSLVNKVFTPRAIGALKPMVAEQIERYLATANPVQFDVVQDFSALFPVEVITRMLGVPAEHRQQVRLWIDTMLHREPGQIGISEAGMAASIASGTMYYHLIQERRKAPRRHRNRWICGLIGRCGCRDGHQARRQRRGSIRSQSRPVAEAARRSQQDSCRRRGTLAL
jgi:cytochrome P450